MLWQAFGRWGALGAGGSASSPATPHRYWRINVASNNGFDWTAIAEWEMAVAAAGADQTGSGTSSSGGPAFDGGGSEHDKAFDNNNSTSWSRFTPTGAILYYDFGAGQEKAIIEHRIRADLNVATSAPNTFTIQWSDDGVNYTTAKSLSGQTWSTSELKTYSIP